MKRGRPHNPDKPVDWSATPDFLDVNDIVHCTGRTEHRVRQAIDNGSLIGRDVGLRHVFSRDAVRAWVEPDLTAPVLTVDAAAALVKSSSVAIKRAIDDGEIVIEDGKVPRAALLAWVGGP